MNSMPLKRHDEYVVILRTCLPQCIPISSPSSRAFVTFRVLMITTDIANPRLRQCLDVFSLDPHHKISHETRVPLILMVI